jgi:hypothetical protein
MKTYTKTKGIAISKKMDDGTLYEIESPKAFFLFLDKNDISGPARYKAEQEIFFQEDGPAGLFQHRSGDLYLITEKGGTWEITEREEEGFGDSTYFKRYLEKVQNLGDWRYRISPLPV